MWFLNLSYKMVRWDAIIVGGGHNGLITSLYLARAGWKVCVLENREVIGGAASTEELIPGYHFSRGAYVMSLLRPQIIREL
jgi:phytoene dehydrogenase-like protein